MSLGARLLRSRDFEGKLNSYMESFPITQLTEGEWTSPRCVEVLGVKLPAYFTTNPAVLAEFMSSFETRPDDVFVVTYPKSGTIWLQEIVWQIHNEGAISEKHPLERVPFLEWASTPLSPLKSSALLIKNLPTPRLLKSHLPYSVVPKSADEDKKCKYIYLARNPKDVAVSYYEFFNVPITGFKGPFEFFGKLFVAGNVPYNLWNDHVLGWWKHKDDRNVLFLKYEDLHKDLVSNVKIIAEFLNKHLSDEVINRIAKQCSFSAMKEKTKKYYVKRLLLRKGVVGDWKNHFTPELNDRFEKEVLAKLKESRLEFDFEI